MIKSSQTSRSIHVESGGRRRVIVSVTTRTRAFLSTIDHHFVSLLAHKNCRTTRCFLFRVDCGNACFVWNILRLCITNRLCTYYLFKGGMATRKACKVTHTSVRDKLTRTLSNFWPYTVQKKKEISKQRRSTKRHFLYKGWRHSEVVAGPPRRIETTRATHGRKKKNRGPFSGSQGMPRVWWLRSRIPPTLEDVGERGYTSYSSGLGQERSACVRCMSCCRSWIRGESRRPICFVTANAPLSFFLFPSPYTLCISFFPSFSLSFVHQHVLSYCSPHCSSTLASRLFRPRRLHASRHRSFTVYNIGTYNEDDVTAGTGLVFESAAPITQGETSLGSPTWSFKVDDGTSQATDTGREHPGSRWWQRLAGICSRSAFCSSDSGRWKLRTGRGHHAWPWHEDIARLWSKWFDVVVSLWYRHNIVVPVLSSLKYFAIRLL